MSNSAQRPDVSSENGPSTRSELPGSLQNVRKEYVGLLELSSAQASKSRGDTTGVYYLYGDERRAVRKFIDENTEFVESCMEDKVNPINIRLEDYWWRMFLEEWAWREG
ncbi:MAG: hypothetical protein SV760_08535 [Halobacteria archaeon]|nr:hypothetical protein [Halobacteria archaeon]